ncbi:hypothetical protein BCUN_1810 [Bifidobacterium cuniculi]|uniref:Uncharacterized protein n=1 Tax=Bifidobacterium cuniculi TaxID=1688 RepID=A0A087AT69_9BIFI|nr:hypothetical protein BCUN_1810 [Bifidobacterium cuniculi]
MGRPTRIIPAYAGQLALGRRRVGRRPDHPRIRGATPRIHNTSISVRGSSPHTRGNCGNQLSQARPRRIIPAYAGQLDTRSQPLTPNADHPRIRGATAWSRGGSAVSGGSSPHTRGNFGGGDGVGEHDRIIPAYAGQLWPPTSPNRTTSDHPRIRGATALASCDKRFASGSSPHTRGNCRLCGSHGLLGRIIPAYAGQLCGWRTCAAHIADHPRIRGATRVVQALLKKKDGSSPHTRGNFFLILQFARQPPDHPRIRGATSCSATSCDCNSGSSPHTRGNSLCHERVHHRPRIIPAYAGQLRACIHKCVRRADHPRIRGATRPRIARSTRTDGSSPHTRGNFE